MPSALTYSVVTRESDTAFGRWLGPWYFTAIGLVMIVVAVAEFSPSIIDPSGRLAPLTPLVAAHGILVFCWLILFVFQTVLIRGRIPSPNGHCCRGASHPPDPALLAGHRADAAPWLRPERRPGGKTDPLFGSIFNFVGLIEFLVMASIALAYRRRTEIHKRFMLFANISLMGAPITHFLGYFGLLSASTGPFMVLGGLALFFLSAVAGDYFRARRVHALTAALAILSFLLLPIQVIIGDSAAWHHFATWLAR